MGKICLSCGLAAPVIAPKSEPAKLPPTCEECPTCPNCRKPLAEEDKKPEEKPASDC